MKTRCGGITMSRKGLIITLFISSFLLFCCNQDVGKVDQGRVIEFDKSNGVVTFIRDLKKDPGNPDYNFLPPLTYTLQSDTSFSGPEPKAGYRLKLDAQNNRIVVYDPVAKKIETIDYKLIDQREAVERDDPRVFNKSTNAEINFPIVDRERKTITVYSRRQKILTTFSVPDRYFALPDKTWDAGDDIRVYFKEEGKAIKLMNISRTDVLKK